MLESNQIPCKDYYRLLNIPVSASEGEIKKAYRKLALQYHPDKHVDGSLVTEKFLAIKEAYLILKDKSKRAAYQQERNRNIQNNSSVPLAENAEEILNESIELHKKIATLNPFRIDFEYVNFAIRKLLSPHQLHLLRTTKDNSIREQFIENIMASSRILPLHMSKPIILILKKMVEDEKMLLEKIKLYTLILQWEYYWNKYQIFVALFVATFICLAIYTSK